MRPPPVVNIAVSTWLLATSIGMGLVTHYAATPGREGKPIERWTAGGLVQVEPERAALLLFLHPMCPCTRATLEELEHLLALCGDAFSTHIVCVVPEGLDERWEKSDLVEHARSLPGVHVWIDDCGTEASRLGALTSGQVLLYDAAGRLVFHGGITAARGHAGESRGADAIVEAARGTFTTGDERRCCPVFGCPLTSEVCPIEREGT